MSRRHPRDKDSGKRSGLSIRSFAPKTENQEKVFSAFSEEMNLLLTGTPGTGKTFVSIYLGLKAVEEKRFKKVIIVRSAVPTRDIGFLPGNIADKQRAYEIPYRAMCSEIYGRGDAYDVLRTKEMIDFVTTSYVRGTTITDSLVLVDEMQNMSDHEIHSVMTRLGEGCSVVFCGDFGQKDLRKEESGYARFVSIAARMKSFTRIDFGVDDIVRGELVREYILARERHASEDTRT